MPSACALCFLLVHAHALLPAGRAPALRAPRSPARVAASRVVRMADDDAEDTEVVEDAVLGKRTKRGVKFKRPLDNRDSLLYRVFDTSPPRAALGLFRLDPTAACGDLLVVGDRNYIVRKVSYRYVYTQGAYRMVQKVLDVKETGRDAVEKSLGRMLP